MKKSMLFLAVVALSLYAPPKLPHYVKRHGRTKRANLQTYQDDLNKILVRALQAEHPNRKFVQKTMQKKPNVNIALIHAAQTGQTRAVVRLIDEHGANASTSDKKKQTPLMLALANQHWKTAQVLLDREADPRPQDEKGQSALIVASLGGNHKLVERLLAGGAPVSATTKKKESALMCAAQNGHLEITRILLAHGARSGQKEETGSTALMLASSHGRPDVVRCLLEHKKGITEEAKSHALAFAIQKGHVDTAQVLLDAGANPEGTLPDDSLTPLMLVLSNFCPSVLPSQDDLNTTQYQANPQRPQEILTMGHQDIAMLEREIKLLNSSIQRMSPDPRALQLLLKHTNVNRIIKGTTPLIRAARYGHEVGVSALLAQGADVHATTSHGINALLCAATITAQPKTYAVLLSSAYLDTVYTTIARYLLDAGIDKEAQEAKKGLCALHLASENGAEQFVQLLIGRGAQIDPFTRGRTTPLMYTAHNGHASVVKLLLNNGANPAHQDDDGDTPLIVAAKEGHYKVVAQLLTALSTTGSTGKKDIVNATNKSKNSALTEAIKGHHDDIARLLLEHGASPKKQDKKGRNALGVAVAHGTKNMARHLRIIMEESTYTPPKPSTGLPQRKTQEIQAHHSIHPLFGLIESGDPALIARLKQGVIDAFAIYQHGTIPLAHAVKLCVKEHTGKRHAVIKALLQKEKIRRSLNFQNEQGKTPLLLAASNPDLTMLLLQNGADPQIVDSWGNTVITTLIQQTNSSDIAHHLKDLLEHLSQHLQASEYTRLLNQQNNKGETALMHAVQKGSYVAVNLLMHAGANDTLINYKGFSALQSAQHMLQKLQEQDSPDQEKIATYQQLVQTLQKTEPHYPESSTTDAEEKKDDDDTTIHVPSSLIAELQKGPQATLDMLKSHGTAGLFRQVSGGTTPLMVAIESGVEEHIVEYLVKRARSGYINLVHASRDDTALSKALKNGHNPKIVALLLRYGSTVRQQDITWVETQLREAQHAGNAPDAVALQSMLEVLLKAQTTTHERNTQLLQAAKEGDLGQLGKALAYGASEHAQDQENNTPLMLAIQHSQTHITRNLIPRSNLNAQNTHGHTALMLSASTGDYDTVERLLQRGADDTLEDGRGETAYAHALKKGHIIVANRIAINRALQNYKNHGDTRHLLNRHYDPEGTKLTCLIRKSNQDTKTRPYCGYVGEQFTSFFPQTWEPHTIYVAIKNVLTAPDKITERPANIDIDGTVIRNALIICGTYQNIPIEVIISHQDTQNTRQYHWKVITAYPIVERTPN